jgi:hypothetical protein
MHNVSRVKVSLDRENEARLTWTMFKYDLPPAEKLLFLQPWQRAKVSQHFMHGSDY